MTSRSPRAQFLALGGTAIGAILQRKRALESYPAVRRCDAAESYHGELVRDPYRWLEDPDSEETAAFVDAQRLRFNRFQASLAHRREFLDRLRTMFDYDKVSCPFKRGEKYFMFRKQGLQQHSTLLCSDRPEGPHATFLDPNTFSEDGTVSLGYYKFSHDGSLMAYQRCESGADWRTVVVRDVATGRDLTRPRRLDVDGPGSGEVADTIERVKFSSIAWTHDNRGFFYCRYPAKADAGQTSAISGRDTASIRDQTMYYHELGTPFVEDQVVHRDPANPKWLFGSEITEDGAALLITAHADCDPVNRMYLCDLSCARVGTSRATGRGPEADYPLLRLVDNFDASWEYLINLGRTYYFFTNLSAPMYRIVRVTVPERLDGFRIEEHVEDVCGLG